MFYNNSLFPLLLSTIAGLSTLVGAIIIFFTQSKNEKFLTFALGFSAGVMIAVSFMDLFPTAESSISKYHGNTPGILWSIFFMLIGAIIAYLIDLLIPESTPNHDIKYDNNFDIFRVGLVSTIALMIHNFPEGIATFVATNSDITLGISLAIAIAMHNIPEGISISVPIYYSTNNKKKALLYTGVSALSEPFGAFLAYIFLKNIMNDLILGILFSLIAGIMLHISFCELLPTARRYNNTKYLIIFFLIGVLFMLMKFIL